VVFLFASIFVAADNALVIDRKMPFPDKGLFGVRAGGGRIPEKLLIGAGTILHRRYFAYSRSERCPRLLFFMGREVFGACQKTACFANCSERGDTAFCVNAPTDTN